jgi:DNA polymerase-3 subunit gamma/tau
MKERPDGVVKINVTGNGFSMQMVRRRKNLDILEKACKEVIGKDVKVQIQAAGSRNNATREKREKESEMKRQALNHPLVAEAVEIFNGNIVEVKIGQEESK